MSSAAFGSPVGAGDLYNIVQLSFWLYNQGWRVARNASQDFKELNEEVKFIREALFKLYEARTQRDTTENYILDTPLARCREALRQYDILLRKYKKLGK